jgi:hypothetical protein
LKESSCSRTGWTDRRTLDADADAGPNGRLLGHMARANPQWRDVEGEVQVIILGPRAYGKLNQAVELQ